MSLDAWQPLPDDRYALVVTSDDERLAEQLLSSLPADAEWMPELERRARRALADPGGGEAWDVVQRRLDARISGR